MVGYGYRVLALAAALALGLSMLSAGAEARRGLEVLKERFRADLLDGSVNADRVERLVASIEDDGNWPGIDYEDVSLTGFRHRDHLDNMLHLARALQKPDSPFHGEGAVRETVLSALDFWLEHDFIADNWWHNEIGTPTRMAEVLTLLEPVLSESQLDDGVAIISRANLDGFGARPGGDLVKIAEIMAQGAALAGDAAVAEAATEAIESELRITTGRGIQPDFSFHHRQDGVITVAYGRGYAAAVANYAAKAQDTVFALREEDLRLAVDLELDGLRWMRVHGVYTNPGVMNREITRRGAVSSAGPERVERWLEATNYRRQDLEVLRDVRAGAREPAFNGNRFYWRSDYLAHQRTAYYASTRMFSSRNHSTEGTYNSEGLKNHHLADGSNFVSITGREYDGVFPVWDWQKIPGTTAVQKPGLPGANAVKNQGLTDFVGGASDDQYGFAAFDFESPLDPLEARKAWFYFDDAYVCLGAGIESDGDYPVATTLNQARLDGAVTVNAGEGVEVLESGAHAVDGASWLHHARIAYVFPAGTPVHVESGPASGHWRRITDQSWATEEEVTEDLFTAWLDHGARPGDETYAYIVAPNVAADASEIQQAVDGLTVLVNTPAVQAVTHDSLGVTQLVFYEAGDLNLPDGSEVAVDQPCLVMLRRSGGEIQSITVADPTQALETLTLRLSKELHGEHAEWDAGAGHTRIAVDLPSDGYAGQSVVLTFGE